jgi:hypothetical protein
MVGDGDFVNARVHAGDFGSDFRLEAEAIFLNFDGLNKLAPEGLVAGFHVREIQIGEHV